MGDKIIGIKEGKRRQIDPIEIEPQALLPTFNKWRATEPEKYRTMVNMICASANITLESLHRGR